MPLLFSNINLELANFWPRLKMHVKNRNHLFLWLNQCNLSFAYILLIWLVCPLKLPNVREEEEKKREDNLAKTGNENMPNMGFPDIACFNMYICILYTS